MGRGEQKRSAIISFAISATVFLFLGIYVYSNREKFIRLLEISYETLLLFGVLVIVSVLLRGFSNLFVYRSLNVPLSLNESVGLALINTLANQLPLAGGFAAKGVYLKTRYKLAYSHYIPATTAAYVLFVAVNGFVGVVCVLYLSLVRNIPLYFPVLLGFLGMFGLGAFLLFPSGKIYREGRWGKYVEEVRIGWGKLVGNKPTLVTIAAFQALTGVSIAIRFMIIFDSLSQAVSFIHCIMFSAASVLTNLVTIAPGGIGVRESIVAGLAHIFGFEFGISAVVVSVDRLLALGIVIGLSGIYSYLIIK